MNNQGNQNEYDVTVRLERFFNWGALFRVVSNIAQLPISRVEFIPEVMTPPTSKIIGEGSYGVVFQLLTVKPNLAMKLININETTVELATLLANEIQKLEKLRHDNIIELIAYFRPPDDQLVGGYIGFLMEFAKYGSLTDVVERAHSNELEFVITWPLILKWLIDIATALAHMHDLGVKHLDLKPENVLVFENFTAKLSDFGLTRNHGNSASLSRAGQQDAHLPVEMTGGDGSELASDLYGYGIIAGYLLAGRPCPKVLRGRKDDKPKRFDMWMSTSPFVNERGFERLRHFILKCLDDRWAYRPIAKRMIQVVHEIKEGFIVDIIPEDRE